MAFLATQVQIFFLLSISPTFPSILVLSQKYLISLDHTLSAAILFMISDYEFSAVCFLTSVLYVFNPSLLFLRLVLIVCSRMLNIERDCKYSSMQRGQCLSISGRHDFLYFWRFKKMFYLFILESEEGRIKRGRKTSIIGCFSHTLNWGPGPQPRHVPQLGTKPATLSSQATTQPTEPHQAWLTSLK